MEDKVYLACAAGKVPASGQFFDYFYGLQLPPGSERQRATGSWYEGNVNFLLKEAINGGFTHICYVDDDFFFPPDMVMKLLAHKKDFVAPLITSRLPPFRPCIFKSVQPYGLEFEYIYSETGLIECVGIGGLPTLTNLKAFVDLNLPQPYYPSHTFNELGELTRSSDIVLTERMVAAGAKVFVDLDIQVWHAGEYSVAAQIIDERWGNIVRIGQNNINMKQKWFPESEVDGNK